ncbi:uncharacterized protein EV420DRAFT_1513343 [Desarmillaria tabescens]|uniref:DNA/RNA-binding protein Alba-like domain-containing protein n=1 Tax=Armillaria tabescens TaxID=1929756 RepID=A0AA39NGI0_ARMTA|nr:uncharacterized protein EV420DRAFT_1513343 [Desarmillaria tabescens]KAK0465217.1 hypothetical protein EV420DRAFT_1513343 [Desarmillaria tabescens]
MSVRTVETSDNARQCDASPQEIRITNHGKMHTWVAFALEHLQKEGSESIVLHTLPAPRNLQEPKPTKGSLSNATTTIPRLISVVEIIKREYVKILELKHLPRLFGLHQYNEISSLEDIGLGEEDTTPEDKEEKRAASIIMALEGKNYPKQVQKPFMRITLSHRELPELVAKGATYQPPLRRKLSKSAKARAKKREKKAQEIAPVNSEDIQLG